MPETNQTSKDEQKRLRDEIRSRTVGYIVGAFGLVAGLAWNEAIQSLIKELFPVDNGGLAAKFIYAAIITVLVVVVSTYFVQFFEKKKDKGESEA